MVAQLEQFKQPIPEEYVKQLKKAEEDKKSEVVLSHHENEYLTSFMSMSAFRNNFYISYKTEKLNKTVSKIMPIPQPLDYSDIKEEFRVIVTYLPFRYYCNIMAGLDQRYINYKVKSDND